jgi:ketosteroid isomerase-like protein
MLFFVLFALTVTLAAAPAVAQEWSPVQKEVWKAVEAAWAAEMSGDLETYMSSYHPEFVGWGANNAFVRSKEYVRQVSEYTKATTKYLIHALMPHAIKVHGNVAIVHYTYVFITEDEEGRQGDQGHYTDVLLKEGDKWLTIADHGESTRGN